MGNQLRVPRSVDTGVEALFDQFFVVGELAAVCDTAGQGGRDVEEVGVVLDDFAGVIQVQPGRLQPGTDGAGRNGLHTEGAKVFYLPGARALPGGAGGGPGAATD